jgi:hypothetical protein
MNVQKKATLLLLLNLFAISSQEMPAMKGEKNTQFSPVRILKAPKQGFQVHKLRPDSFNLPFSLQAYSHLAFLLKVKKDGRISLGYSGKRGHFEDTMFLKAGKTHRILVDLEALPNTQHYLEWDKPEFLNIGLGSEIIRLSVLEVKPVTNPGFQKSRVDSFGQRKRGEWPGKVKSVKDLIESKNKEHIGLSKPPQNYGEGFFSIAKEAAGWTLIAPDGAKFWSLGVTGVRLNRPGFLTPFVSTLGREALFEKLPPDSLNPNRLPGYANYYHWNVLRKYGTPHAWKTNTARRLTDWGFNTLGNWSDTLWQNNPMLPWCETLRSNESKRLCLPNNLPNVFHPDWEPYLDSLFSGIARFSSDPYLLGYFVDNELPWEGLKNHLPQGETVTSYARKYFSTIQRLIKKYDPNHLYLGCRFVSKMPEKAIITEASNFTDLISINLYHRDPELLKNWHHSTSKPILVSEFHFQMKSRRQIEPNYPVFPEPHRSEMVREFLEEIRSLNFVVGAHWYQFTDQPLLGRIGNSENQNIGLVDVVDIPHDRLISTFKAFHQKGLKGRK